MGFNNYSYFKISRNAETMRCIIFVDRVVAAAVISSLIQKLYVLLSVTCDYIARGANSATMKSTKKSYKTFQMARWVLYFCHVIVYCLIWYNELESFIKWPVNMLNRWNSWFQLILGRRALMWKVAAVSFVLIWQRQQRAGFNLVAVLV